MKAEYLLGDTEMTNRYKSVFDIIGPIMVGPSSSHTAGAVAIGRAGNKLFGGVPRKVTVHYYGSFAQTHRGHGTDYAIAAGILGFDTDDLRVPNAPEIAKKRGIDIRFVEEDGPSPIDHPNTAILDMSSGTKKAQISGCSIGGGSIEIRHLIIHDTEITPTGSLPIIIWLDYEKDILNEQNLTSLLREKAPFSKKRIFRTKDCNIYEYDIDNYLKPVLVKELKEKFENIICL